MPGPLLFIVFVIGVDILLKSVKDKKKIEEAKAKRAQEMYKEPNNKTLKDKTQEKPKTLKDIREILEDEIQRERQKEIDIRKRFEEPKKSKEEKKVIIEKPREIRESNIKEEIKEKPFKDNNIREDILRGIIFSEILSEPKALRKRNL